MDNSKLKYVPTSTIALYNVKEEEVFFIINDCVPYLASFRQSQSWLDEKVDWQHISIYSISSSWLQLYLFREGLLCEIHDIAHKFALYL